MSCIGDSAAIYIMVVKFRNTIWPPPPQLSRHKGAALLSNSNGTRSYIAERTQNAVYCILWDVCEQDRPGATMKESRSRIILSHHDLNARNTYNDKKYCRPLTAWTDFISIENLTGILAVGWIEWEWLGYML
jgi:hypothetical protein